MGMSMYTKSIGGAGFIQFDGYVYVHLVYRWSWFYTI